MSQAYNSASQANAVRKHIRRLKWATFTVMSLLHFNTHTIKDLVEAVRKDIRQLTTHGFWRPTDPLFSTSGNAVHKDIRPEETFTHTCFILEKPNHCFGIFSCVHGRGPQRHTGWRNIYCQISYTLTHTQSLQSAKTYNIAFRFSLFFVAAVHKDIRPMAAVRKDIRAEETFTVRSPTL